ncbi:D-alanine--D-alanine ligase family protein [Amycolatopsis magusensis]|uniref:D-alanine--D-alanine ligase n=1 Tax=Amycolatopsis magusensis TaxID=882444 RepID=A0ABS4Q4P5_9PSEU|nr:D-alanine--D-alanine ligase family protein [Amycolatopsis magusensis]MBP2186647.1 D-alanine-D-alanine ligase [Amycolatopsis magusensis]MDI5982664.1 D-alanine--D-alanine ligase family protein [Amycolatopsis magusensis]
MSPAKTRVAVVFGGRSTEHTISCVSAGSVLANLDPERFEIVPIGITREGGWVLGPSDPDRLRIDGDQLPVVHEGRSLVLTGDRVNRELVSLDAGVDAIGAVDVIFPVLHGAFGEDGTIQGLLELADVPYVGAGVLASATAMDKEFAKKLLAAEGLPSGEYAVLRRGQSTLPDAERERLGLPVFVKPARAGSSIGISKVTDWSQLDAAIALARETDPKVLVEAAVVGRELECGVLEFPDGRVEASLPAEIRVLATDESAWYDFETKYLGEAAELDIPAKLDDQVTERLREMAVAAFHALDCQGLARVDFFVGADGELTINEVNTMPGFTTTSAYPKMWAVTGVDYPTLLSTLVETAIARGTGLR